MSEPPKNERRTPKLYAPKVKIVKYENNYLLSFDDLKECFQNNLIELEELSK